MRCGKNAIATAIGTDFDDLQPYQGTRCSGVWQNGRLYTSCRVGQKPKADQFDWERVKGTEWFTDMHGIEIYQDKVFEAAELIAGEVI